MPWHRGTQRSPNITLGVSYRQLTPVHDCTMHHGFHTNEAFGVVFLWSPYGIEQTIIFLHCGFFFFLMVALCNRGPLYFCPCGFCLLLSFFFSSPNLSRRRLDVYHTL